MEIAIPAIQRCFLYGTARIGGMNETDALAHADKELSSAAKFIALPDDEPS